MNPLLEQLKHIKEKDGEKALDAFFENHHFPIVEEDGVTFVYRGEADEVHLQHWIYGLPSSQRFQALDADKDLWHLHLELPKGSRIEYKFNVVKDGEGRWIEDPLNDLKAFDPFGANSVCRAYGYTPPAWTQPDPDARPGVIDDISLPSKVFGAERRFKLYLPARYRKTRRYPLLIVHDGTDYLRYASLKTVLDNLIHRLEIPAMVVALTHSPDRLAEYAADPRHADHLAQELVPYLEKRLPLIGRPEARGLMGASFGAVASLHAAWAHQNTFGRLLLQSGSFAFSDIGQNWRGPVFDPVVQFMNRFRKDPGRPSRKIFITCGIYESLIYENRSLVPLLQESGLMQVRYREARDGHNWENWRDRLRDALSWLFPGPLWMIYE
ncbi:MAG TPA: alpha/beta hydrolase-fold protein [Acidobacteriota bacterium]|nr:alpha/beta hydrolase-fold protein [Acidobacteriota bacterium]